MNSKLLLSLFIWFYLNTIFHLEQHCYFLEHTVLNDLQKFQTDWVESSTKYILVIHNSCSIDYPLFCNQYHNNILYCMIQRSLIIWSTGGNWQIHSLVHFFEFPLTGCIVCLLFLTSSYIFRLVLYRSTNSFHYPIQSLLDRM